ncbi:MAG: excinuclease [Aliivibrio sp.]|uniref:excinuclease n=1 Tax=Aliivibrio sp. TaxID=1872443 RepID=UPI001A4E91AE|nr:excinuclease [Aliivibrio sp.]
MKKFFLLLLINLCVVSSNAQARDEVLDFSIQNALDLVAAKEKLGTDVAFFFGEQKHGKTEPNYVNVKTNKKTNAFNKTDEEACQWVFLSAMIALKERAVKEGYNAVVEIKSNYKNNLTSNEKTFQCGAGTFVAGVALTGKLVTIK